MMHNSPFVYLEYPPLLRLTNETLRLAEASPVGELDAALSVGASQYTPHVDTGIRPQDDGDPDEDAVEADLAEDSAELLTVIAEVTGSGVTPGPGPGTGDNPPISTIPGGRLPTMSPPIPR
jgi:hypothetical protein